MLLQLTSVDTTQALPVFWFSGEKFQPLIKNGIILSYTVTYKALPNGIELTKNVTAPTTQATLRDLNEYTNYSITVFAVTAVGRGNTSKPIIVITDEDSKFFEVVLISVRKNLWPIQKARQYSMVTQAVLLV